MHISGLVDFLKKIIIITVRHCCVLNQQTIKV